MACKWKSVMWQHWQSWQEREGTTRRWSGLFLSVSLSPSLHSWLSRWKRRTLNNILTRNRLLTSCNNTTKNEKIDDWRWKCKHQWHKCNCSWIIRSKRKKKHIFTENRHANISLPSLTQYWKKDGKSNNEQVISRRAGSEETAVTRQSHETIIISTDGMWTVLEESFFFSSRQRNKLKKKGNGIFYLFE